MNSPTDRLIDQRAAQAADDHPPRAPGHATRGRHLAPPDLAAGPHGIGDLGAAAYRFVEMLEAARQTIWQLMPLGPVGLGNSPYAASSAFAGFPLLIALDQLTGRGWLDQSDLDAPDFPPAQVQFEGAASFKMERLHKAFGRFEQAASGEDRAALDAFQQQHRAWLDDYGLFMALKDAHGGSGWMDWDRPLALREADALARRPPDPGRPRSASTSGCSGSSSGSGPRSARTPTSAAS